MDKCCIIIKKNLNSILYKKIKKQKNIDIKYL